MIGSGVYKKSTFLQFFFNLLVSMAMATILNNSKYNSEIEPPNNYSAKVWLPLIK